MTTIKLHNTRTRKKEVFAPLDPENVRMYVCGPTVYDRAHLGNARPVVVFDVLYRLLRHVYGPEHVTYVRNFTDVDDKINARAAESGRAIGEITAETTQWFLDDMAELGALEPDHMPRATQYIPQMVAMIEDLIAKGHAYEAEGHVLFAVDSWREGYGKLSGRTVDDMIAGARVEVAPYKRNPMDFVLWKASDEGQPGWDSPWGRGRPGWHIECSAMAEKLLWEDVEAKLSPEAREHPHTFDIHGGGNDLMFPHHENEIAQSCCAHPEGEFARYWLHNEMLQVEGKKMSKSLGNFFTVRDLLDQGIPGEVIRFVFLSTHYRKPMDWTAEKSREARVKLAHWRALLDEVGPISTSRDAVDESVVINLAEDLNTKPAIDNVASLAKRLEASLKAERQRADGDVNYPRPAEGRFELALKLKSTAELLGLLTDDIGLWAKDSEKKYAPVLSQFTERVATERMAAMVSKDFSELDRLKAELVEAGVEVRMSKEGVDLIPGPDFDPVKLEALK
ncbi:cysteine--tRNA ligase [Roseovarius sp. A-2]|uniref:cysteine--tRNA ligase n=1 Tax=Roseovarius sp. A-2 TaxID=1570360 RepID=UPI0009B5144E|nr:cysteine--tRNA ligase [Roseovarius sp. A-2]GAW35117.1 cysteine--tRNA ligase [Roseovarius sp. A-2]